MKRNDEVVTYDDLIDSQEMVQLAALRREQEVTAKPLTKNVTVTVAITDPYLLDGPKAKPVEVPTARKLTDAEKRAEAAYDATLCTGFFGKPKAATLTKDRLEMHAAAIRVASRHHWSMRRGGLSALTIARNELGLPKSASKDDVLAEIASRVG